MVLAPSTIAAAVYSGSPHGKQVGQEAQGWSCPSCANR